MATMINAKSLAGLKDVFDTHSKIALGLGVVLFLLGAAGGVHYGGYFPVSSLWEQLALMLAGALVAAASFTKSEAKAGLRADDIKKLGIKIQYPRPDDKIKGLVRVVVESSKPLPEGYELRVLRGSPDGKRFVPNEEAHQTSDRLEWIVEAFDIAGKQGEVRRIEVWLVGADGRALLDNWQANHKVLAEANRKMKALGSEDFSWLPWIVKHTADMHRCVSIPVMRDA